MKQFKKAAIIGMSVLTAAAVPAVATIINSSANEKTFVVAQNTQATETTKDIVIKDSQAENNPDYELQLNNYNDEKHKFITNIIVGSAITLTLFVGCVLLIHKIKKINELNRSIEATREANNLFD